MNRSVTMMVVTAAWLAIGKAAADTAAELRPLLAEAAAATGMGYVALRDRIVGISPTNALWEAAENPRLDWRERLVARIALERKLRAEDIRALRYYDWPSDPEFNRDWLKYATGFGYRMGPLSDKRFREAGLWYYFLELNWKDTKEGPSRRHGAIVTEVWPRGAAITIKAEPEGWYLDKVTCDFILHEPLSRGPVQLRGVYDFLIKGNTSDAAPVLVERFDEFLKAEYGPRSEELTWSQKESFRYQFNRLLSIADTRHEMILRNFISERLWLHPLQDTLSEVRNRPAPEPMPEPPFRLMPTPEFLKTGPFVTDPAPPRPGRTAT